MFVVNGDTCTLMTLIYDVYFGENNEV